MVGLAMEIVIFKKCSVYWVSVAQSPEFHFVDLAAECRALKTSVEVSQQRGRQDPGEMPADCCPPSQSHRNLPIRWAPRTCSPIYWLMGRDTTLKVPSRLGWCIRCVHGSSHSFDTRHGSKIWFANTINFCYPFTTFPFHMVDLFCFYS